MHDETTGKHGDKTAGEIRFPSPDRNQQQVREQQAIGKPEETFTVVKTDKEGAGEDSYKCTCGAKEMSAQEHKADGRGSTAD